MFVTLFVTLSVDDTCEKVNKKSVAELAIEVLGLKLLHISSQGGYKYVKTHSNISHIKHGYQNTTW